MQSSKSQHYLNQCIQAAEKSTMSFTLGAVLVKGGKVIAHGHNHQRTNYDGSCKQPGRKPISMHAEMHTISNATGLTPSFKSQLQPYFEEKQGKQQQAQQAHKWDGHLRRSRCLWHNTSRVGSPVRTMFVLVVKPLEVDIMAYVTQADRKIADGSFEFI
ncbi:deoxycytidylate deaminase (dCMP deaminase) [Ceratobasidium sp. AG-Ba]|nr:deoxycytidylate deaminase (dCMP deaminase) [Ceratobasidium sp. AG-Ba]